MSKFIQKIKSRKGESFIEILIAILIVAFGCMLIATMFSAAMRLNIFARDRDEEFYKNVSEMEELFARETGHREDNAVCITGEGKKEDGTLDTTDGSLEVSAEIIEGKDSSAYRR